ncbi:MAG: hypothetical protein LBF83_10165, partial [Spirochaetaceae bacterium]|nr:hypothetical protein [Spirochaetaceae bacterium]
ACEQRPPESEDGPLATFTPPSPPPLPTSDPVSITSEDALKNICKTASGRRGYYKLTADISVNGWTPLGTSNAPFTGAFDGDNHTITFDNAAGGLFAYTKAATVWNLKIAGTITVTSETGAVKVGGISGNAEWTHITGCDSSVNITAVGNEHNSSAGGIVGFMRDRSMIRSCTASGNVTLNSNEAGLMVYAGGIAGYSGTGTYGAGASGCLITGSRWTGGLVSAVSGYPYAGGVVGYNYTGAHVTQCGAAGTVRAWGANLPYAGGVSGYNSGYVSGTAIVATIENCYSTAAVNAVSTSKAALAGGIAGANAKHALISKCYATGAVTAAVAGNGTSKIGGSLGVKIAANAGGIAGAQYYSENPIGIPNATINFCAALNASITGADSAAGAEWNIYRISGEGADGDNGGKWTANIAWSDLPVTRGDAPPYFADSDANGKDGADASSAKPAQPEYAALGWDFASVWEMGTDGYPALR